MSRDRERARVHLEFCSKLYQIQIREGRYFLHEHPMTAESWKEPCIAAIEDSPLVFKVRTDMCSFGMTSSDENGEGPVLKPTSFLTNSIEVSATLDSRCKGCERHVHLISGRAAAAQVYPKALCRAIVRGIIKQAQHDAGSIMCMQCTNEGEEDIASTQPEAEVWKQYWDDISGQELDSKLTSEARAEEVAEIHRMGVYEKVTIEECLRETGKLPVGTRWIDTNKGDSTNPKIRSRLVAQELNLSKQPELFAATPPIEYVRYLVSCVASSQFSPEPRRLMVQDVKKAYFYAPATRKIYVKLPDEDRGPDEQGLCGILRKSLY